MTTRIKLRRDTAANWTSNDPVLALGEAGYDTTNNELRVGDGTTVWSLLSAIGGSGISSNVAIAPEFGPAVTFARPEDVATDAVNAVDVIDTGVALGRDSNQGGLLNTLEDNLNGYNNQSYNGQPTHTEWNTDGLEDLSNVTTRTYQDFRAMKQDLGDDGFLATHLVMHDTLNDKYYTFKFDRWSVGDNGGDGGFGYVRRLINHTQYFTKTNYGNELDSIDTGLVITRGNNGGIYNDESEGGHNSDVSPQGTEWNIDGWSDLSNLLTRTYTNFTSAFSYQVGNRILGKEAIMHDTINDKYYAVKFLQWTNNNNGGGFTWQRRLIDTTQLDEGVHFADGTVQTTAGLTFNDDGSFELPGGLNLPFKSNTGYRYNSTLNGRTLQLSPNDTQNEVIITGPASTANNPYAQRIVIQGQRGYGVWGQNTAGEGGDVYIWGGVGGERDGSNGGSGGDVKLRGGQGQDNEGGYVRIEGGDARHNSTYSGNGGFVEITGGDVADDGGGGGDAGNRGGDIRITGGRAFSESTQSGFVQVITGGIAQGNVIGDHTWTFGNDGNLTAPGNIVVGGNNDSHFVIDGSSYWTSIQWKNMPTMQDPTALPFECQAQLLRVFSDADNEQELVAVSGVRNEGTTYNGVMITTSDGQIPEPNTGNTGTNYSFVFGGDGSLSLPARTASTATATGGVIKIKGSVRTLPGDIQGGGIPGTSSLLTAATDIVIWTADSVLVTAAKITLRVGYYNPGAGGWDNTEIIELLITKTNPGQGSTSSDANIAVIGRVKTNAGYADSTVDWDTDGDGRLVLLSTPDATKSADCNIYWNYDVVAFEHTLD